VKISVVSFPGSNCDEDALHVAQNLLQTQAEIVWHKDKSLPVGTDLVIIPGGFSFGDALRAGALARFSPIMEAVKQFAEAGGFVLGICNGFQVLVEAGLLPGAMLPNVSRKFVCKNIRLKVETLDSAFTCALDKDKFIKMPIAHHEGRYHIDETGLADLKTNDQIAFTYADDNPNGAIANIAGIFNAKRNILGMMPHPERASETILGSRDGFGLFQSLKSSIEVSA
jgi:phosphoribosylformylglycinamidine synthase I